MPKRILVTRPAAQNQSLVAAIEEQGDIAVVLPLLAISTFTQQDNPECAAQIKSRIEHLAEYQHIIFISTNAVEAGWHWIDHFCPQYRAKMHAGQSWYAIGTATAAALNKHVGQVEQAGLAMNSEALLQHANLQKLQQQKVLLVRGLGGREYLQQQLQERGAEVDYCEVYQRRPVTYSSGELKQLLEQGIDFLTVTSAETIQQLVDQAIIDGIKEIIMQITIITPGKRLYLFAKQIGFQCIIQAENASLSAMLMAIHNKKV